MGYLWRAALLASLAVAALAETQEARVLIPQSVLARRAPAPAAAWARSIPYRKLSPPIPPTAAEEMVVGITFWRLRPARRDDDPATRLLILDDDTGEAVEQVPERIEAGSPVKPGERIRLSLEVPRGGFLYIFDREQYASGELGPAHQIYPNRQTPPGDNAVAAGRLLEVPDRRDRINSFKLFKSRADHTGETLIVLICPEPLPELPAAVGGPSPVVDEELLGRWEKSFGVQIEHLELEGGAGAAITSAEMRSGADARQPLGPQDPPPQSIYRFRAQPGKAVLLKVPLRLAS